MGVVVGVVGARGGGGATVVAAALAHAFASRLDAVTLVDLAAENGGIDIVLGTEEEPGLRWPDLAEARGVVDGAALRQRLPRWGRVAVVGATRDGPARTPQDAVADVCVALADGSDALVIDFSRSVVCGPAPQAASVLRHCDEVLIVTPLDLPAVSGALVARDSLARLHARTALVVRGPAPGSLDAGEVGEVLGMDIACTVGWDPHLAGAMERGSGPVAAHGPLRRASKALAERYLGRR